MEDTNKINGYELSRNWFNFCFDNPELIKPTHTAIYFFAIEHCNRLGWKEKFGFPSQMVMEAIGVKNWRTYSKALIEIVDFGFIKMIEISKNQYSSNIIAIVKKHKAPTKALDKALLKHSTNHSQSTVSIDKQYNNTTNNNITIRKTEFKNSLQPFLENYGKDMLNNFFEYWTEKKPKGRKMLFEMQKTFDVSLRLKRWDRNNFNKQKEKPKKEDAAKILQRKYGLID